MEEAARTSRSGALLRELFVIILRFCTPSNPRQLFDNHWIEWKDDFQARAGWKEVMSLSEAQTHQVILKMGKHFHSVQPSVASEGAP